MKDAISLKFAATACPVYHKSANYTNFAKRSRIPGENLKLELRKRVLERLQADPGTKLTAAEIARWIVSTYPAECAQKIADSTVIETDDQLFAQLRAEIYGSHRNWQHQDLTLRKREIEAESVAFLVCHRNRVWPWSERYLSEHTEKGTDIDSIDLHQIMRAAGQVEALLGLTAHTKFDRG
jgi:hypothetical protein